MYTIRQEQQQFQQSQQNPQQWTVHAQLTISHDGINSTTTATPSTPQTRTDRDENGVRMVYTWSSADNKQKPQNECTDSMDQLSGSGLRRGNMFFSSIPPSQSKQYESSGYGSDLFSPNSFQQQHKCSNNDPNNRKCKSSCSIVLSTNINEEYTLASDAQHQQASSCARAHSLRCQTPFSTCTSRTSNIPPSSTSTYYGCGDPWCHHLPYDETSKCSTVFEADEDASTVIPTSRTRRPSRASTFNESISKQQPLDRWKDACVQTYEMVDKCTSPLIPADHKSFAWKEDRTKSINESSGTKKHKGSKQRKEYGLRKRIEPISSRRTNESPASLFSPDSLETINDTKRQLLLPSVAESSKDLKTSDTSSGNNNNKPRTVHIDVYCTGTDAETDSDSSTSDRHTASTAQTVFEDEKMLLKHREATKELPYQLKKSFKMERSKDSQQEDDLSSLYPSMSSISGLRDFGSSLSSMPPSYSTISVTSSALPIDSIDTSCKDTFSDFSNLSKATLAQTESLDFVPRCKNLDKTESSTGNIHNKLSQSSLGTADSFEYANAEDRNRIRFMEKLWLTQKINQEKMQEYFNQKIKPVTKQSDSDSDASEKEWSFVKEDTKLNRYGTIRRVQQEPTKSPSIMIIQEKLKLNPTLRAPFSLLPGVFTEQRHVARKFGPMVHVFRKPGHHIGPAKNPDCKCDHCRSYFENEGYRRRATSVDSSYDSYYNWKENMRGSAPPGD